MSGSKAVERQVETELDLDRVREIIRARNFGERRVEASRVEFERRGSLLLCVIAFSPVLLTVERADSGLLLRFRYPPSAPLCIGSLRWLADKIVGKLIRNDAEPVAIRRFFDWLLQRTPEQVAKLSHRLLQSVKTFFSTCNATGRWSFSLHAQR